MNLCPYVPSLFKFTVRNGQLLNWVIMDPETLLPITGASITASLFYGRSSANPNATPGEADPNFNGIQLLYVKNVGVEPVSKRTLFFDSEPPSLTTGTAAQYTGTIPSAFDPGADNPPNPYGGGYTLVVDMTAPGYVPQHWEIPAIVQVRTK